MATTRILSPERRALVADALLLTTAVAGSVLALVTLLSEAVGDAGWYSAVSNGLLLAAVLLCPLAVWRLRGRRSGLRTVAGAATGFVVGGVVLMLLLMVVAAIAFVVSFLSGGAVSEGMVAFVVIGAALSALIAWLVTDAVRDLSRPHRHVGLDVARLVALAMVLVTTAGALWWAWAHPGEEPAELLAFGLAAGVVGGCTALGADLVEPDAAPRPVAPRAPVR
ncbi:MAG TPA: hypothetical protein VFI44_10115 [Ornithinibacter sp.]|nr:hypothetical protein [Ornithinibacter sp.]